MALQWHSGCDVCRWHYCIWHYSSTPVMCVDGMTPWLYSGMTAVMCAQVESGSEQGETSQGGQTVNVELSKETLDTMLDGLSKIRDQLSSVANR